MPGFLKLSGIRGESQDAVHAGWIDIGMFSWSTNSAAAATSITGGGRRDNLHGIVVTKKVDASSARLRQASVKGTPIEQATIDLVSDDGKVYMSVRMTNVSISNVQGSGSGGESRPLETVSLNFEHAAMTQGVSAPAGPAGSMFSSATTAIAAAIGSALARAARGP